MLIDFLRLKVSKYQALILIKNINRSFYHQLIQILEFSRIKNAIVENKSSKKNGKLNIYENNLSRYFNVM